MSLSRAGVVFEPNSVKRAKKMKTRREALERNALEASTISGSRVVVFIHRPMKFGASEQIEVFDTSGRGQFKQFLGTTFHKYVRNGGIVNDLSDEPSPDVVAAVEQEAPETNLIESAPIEIFKINYGGREVKVLVKKPVK